MKDKITGFILKAVGPGTKFSEDDDIFERGLVTSMFSLQLIMFLESEFGIKVANEDLQIRNFNTVNHIVEFMKKKKSAE